MDHNPLRIAFVSSSEHKAQPMVSTSGLVIIKMQNSLSYTEALLCDEQDLSGVNNSSEQ